MNREIHDGNRPHETSKRSDGMDKPEIYKPHEVLGVRENATREEIEKRYYILAKKHLILKRENLGSEVPGLNMEKINEAYIQLINNLNRSSSECNSEHNISDDKKIPLPFLLLSKFKHYLQEYNVAKYVTVIILVFISILAIRLFNLIASGNNEETINIAFFGYFDYNKEYCYNLAEDIKKRLEAIGTEKVKIGKINTQMVLLEDEAVLPYKLDMMLNAYYFITRGNYHILIMDRRSFEEYGIVTDMAKLDHIAEKLGVSSDSCFKLKLNGNEEEHVYGLAVKNISSDGNNDNNSPVILAVKNQYINNEKYINIVNLLVKGTEKN